jgi:hypothetical protein
MEEFGSWVSPHQDFDSYERFFVKVCVIKLKGESSLGCADRTMWGTPLGESAKS